MALSAMLPVRGALDVSFSRTHRNASVRDVPPPLSPSMMTCSGLSPTTSSSQA